MTIFVMIKRYFRTEFCRHLRFLARKAALTLPPAKSIADLGRVCRHLKWKHMYPKEELHSQSAFMFQPDARGVRAESLTWRKFAPDDADVHFIGRRDVAKRNKQRGGVGKAQEYKGFIEAVVGDLRCCRTARGHTVKITHEPDDGCHHAEVTIVPLAGTEIKPNDKRDIVDEIWKCFSDPVEPPGRG